MEIDYIDVLINAVYEEENQDLGEEYLQLVKEFSKVYRFLMDKIPFDASDIFKEYEKLLNEKNKIQEEYMFKRGFKLGANFILDIKKD